MCSHKAPTFLEEHRIYSYYTRLIHKGEEGVCGIFVTKEDKADDGLFRI